MSWIVKDLWKTLERQCEEYENLLDKKELQAYGIINRIASEVGNRHGVFLQVNFPPGQRLADPSMIGHWDLSILVHRNRKTFQGISEYELKEAFRPLSPISFDSAGFGWEGFRVKLSSGRIDCLPGGVHIWCEVTPGVLQFLDWLFENAYQVQPETSA